MTFFLAGLRLQLVRLLRQKALFICLLLLPLFTVAMGLLLPPEAEANLVKVGIWLPERSARAELMWRRMLDYSDAKTLFVRAESEDQLRAMVAGRVWEVGYMFAEDLDERLDAGDYRRIITRVKSPASMTLFTGGVISSVVLEVCAPDIAAAYLIDSGLASSPGELPPFEGGVYGENEIIELQTETVGGAPLTVGAALAGATLVRGVSALLLFLVAYFLAVRHREDMDSGFFSRLAPFVPPAKLLLPSLCAGGLLMLIGGLLAAAAGRAFFPAHYAALGAEALLLLLYLANLFGFASLLYAAMKNRDLLIAALPFWIIAGLLLSPILFDLGQWIPAARWLGLLLPPSLYMRAAASSSALWQSALMAGLSFLAGLLLSGRSAPHSPPDAPEAL